MKKGSIIRRNVYGRPLGKYLKVTDVTKDGIFAEVLGNSSEFRIVGNYIELNVHRLSISSEEFKRLATYGPTTVTSICHEATKNWDALIDKIEEGGIDLVMLYSKEKKLYFPVAGVTRIYKFIWNKERTRGSKKPCIRLFLEHLIAEE